MIDTLVPVFACMYTHVVVQRATYVSRCVNAYIQNKMIHILTYLNVNSPRHDCNFAVIMLGNVKISMINAYHTCSR